MSGWAGKMNRQMEEEVPLDFSKTVRSVGRLARVSEAVMGEYSPVYISECLGYCCYPTHAGEVVVESLEFPCMGVSWLCLGWPVRTGGVSTYASSTWERKL
ncbi:hypothetical protein ElyMa_006561900 [Elysia marginata]|uniref:Uncharacterized protein n=1 Tax=Elysia marginata TaxID=1093978 RepID=A0AAV4IB49_9GAST|nr:hypothetical protein ElyMa_006561900 [Elysia marginata]